jgi:hypothetical protein
MKWTASTIVAIGSSIGAVSVQRDPVKTLNPVPIALMPPRGISFHSRRTRSELRYTCARPRQTTPISSNGRSDADLCDESGRRIARDFAGPTRQASGDSSKVIGTLTEKLPAPNRGDILWLLLKGKPEMDQGRFSRVTYI